MPVIGSIMLIIHFFLFFWAVGGILEMILPAVFWKPFTNPSFPDWVLTIHWGSILFASIVFICGYLTHWSKTPQIMIFGYGLMGVACAIETFGFMTGRTKYVAMAAEYIAYLVILLVLFKVTYFIRYFNK